MFRSSTIIRELALNLAKVIFVLKHSVKLHCYLQGGSNMTGTDLCVNKPVTVPVIFEPPCSMPLCGIMLPHNRILNNDLISPNVLT